MLVLKTTAQLHFSLSTTEQIVSSVANRITEFVIERQQIYTKPRQKHGICFHSLNKTRLASLRDKPFQRTALLEAKLFRKLVAEGMEQVTSLQVNSQQRFHCGTQQGTCRRELLRGPVPQCVPVFFIDILVEGTIYLVPTTGPTN